MSNSRPETRGYKHSALCACAGAFQTPLRARDNGIGVGSLSRHRRWRGLGAFVCDGIARETVEGRGAVSGSLAGMFRRGAEVIHFPEYAPATHLPRSLGAHLPTLAGNGD